MQIWKDLSVIELPKQNISLTIGNFDGLHLGHQFVINSMPSNTYKIALTFDNHPSEILPNRTIQKTINTSTSRLKLLKSYGVDGVIIIPFTPFIAQKTAEEFINYIFRYIPFENLVLGHDAVFGKKRQGTPEVIRALSKTIGFTTHYLPPLAIDGFTVSSSLIREKILSGELEFATKLLGRPYSISTVSDKTTPLNHWDCHLIECHPISTILPPTGTYSVKIIPTKQKESYGIAVVDHDKPLKIYHQKTVDTSFSIEIMFKHLLKNSSIKNYCKN